MDAAPREVHAETPSPMLHIRGTLAIVFPVENWDALNSRLPTLRLHAFPRCGHGPRQAHSRAAAECIGTFVARRGVDLSPQ